MAVDRVGHSLTRTPDELETLLEEVIDRLGPEPTTTRGVALAALLEAATAVWTSAFDRQLELFDEAMTIGLALPDSTEKAFILSKWSSRYILDDHPLVATACDASRRQWEQSNDPTTEAEWRLARLEGRFLPGPFFEVTADEALEQVERLERLTLDIRDPILAARTSWVSTGTLIDRGDLDRADARITGEERTDTDRLAGALWRSFARQLSGEVRYHQGRMAQLAESSSRLVATARNEHEAFAWSGGNSLALLADGRPDDATFVLDRSVDSIGKVVGGPRLLETFVLSWLAEAAASVDHVPMLTRCREIFAACRGVVVGGGAAHGTTDLWCGVVESALGDIDQADRSFAAAETHCLRLDLPLWVNLTRCFWAESLHPRDPDRSRLLAQAALAGAEPLGHHVAATRARAILDE